MILRAFILTVILLSILIPSLSAEVYLSFEGNNLLVSSDQKGVEGYKSCNTKEKKLIPAYTFRLLKKETPASNSICRVPLGRWNQIKEQTSNNDSVIFKNLKDGEYKVICLIGKAEGCEIKNGIAGMPDKAIVFTKEQSYSIFKGIEVPERRKSLQSKNSKLSGLTLYPNPVQTELNIETIPGSLYGAIQLSIFDLLGKLIFEKNYQIGNKGFEQKISTKTFPAGTYLIKIIDENGKSVERKFVVIHK